MATEMATNVAPLSVAGKCAMITGAGSGINLAFARLLLERGCSVLIGDLNLRPEAQQLLSEYPHPQSKGPSALFHHTDVTSWPQLSSLFQRGLSSFGKVDIICPGAGLFEPDFASFWNPPKSPTNPDTPSVDSAVAEPGTYKLLEVNLTHPIRLSQLGISHWTRNNIPGTLVHIGSIAGYTAAIGTPLYFASKHGLHGFVRSLGSLRDEVGIRVGAVAPGPVRTPMWSEDPTKAAMSGGGQEITLRPEEIAESMLRLCEDPELGDGTILEVLAGATRVLSMYNAPAPSGKDVLMKGYAKAGEALLEELKTKGLTV
ncbi:short chain dehydrogenase [Xylariaceae sp. FL0016]|nr:short chain dehydrogenase [Xylariaceae sp. FL0016]